MSDFQRDIKSPNKKSVHFKNVPRNQRVTNLSYVSTTFCITFYFHSLQACAPTQLCKGAQGDLCEHQDQPQEGEEAHCQGVVLQALRSGCHQWGIKQHLQTTQPLGMLKTN